MKMPDKLQNYAIKPSSRFLANLRTQCLLHFSACLMYGLHSSPIPQSYDGHHEDDLGISLASKKIQRYSVYRGKYDMYCVSARVIVFFLPLKEKHRRFRWLQQAQEQPKDWDEKVDHEVSRAFNICQL